MIRSMTGFGRGEETLNGRNISIEIKSVNHRYFEFNCRMPRFCDFCEDKLKNLVASRVSRGKIDLNMSITRTEGEDFIPVLNSDVAADYIRIASDIADEYNLPNDMSAVKLMKMPDVLTLDKATVDEDSLWEDIKTVAQEAIENFVAMREVEGERLKNDLLEKLDFIESQVAIVEEESPKTLENYRNRLYKKLSEVLADRTIDESRILTECAIFADKIAVDEETVRLHSHLNQFRHILSSDEAVGRKLDFLTQEINRETNTIGSKSQSTNIANVVITIKTELEKVREQIQNLE